MYLVSTLVVTSKKNGVIRMCIDPQPITEVLKHEHYEISTIDGILPELFQKMFTMVDLRTGLATGCLIKNPVC